MFWHFLWRFALRRDGAVAIEFAFVGPILTLMLLGMIAYGGVFWTSHSVQQLANDAARASVAGLTEAERAQLAQAVVRDEVGHYGHLVPGATSVTVDTQATASTVRVSYDASNSVFWAMAGVVPMPSSTVVRSATVRLGGY